tara:strand:- start:1305 stop:1628 length:324 start_codon:yes stop_codon:yes gene_type:complete
MSLNTEHTVTLTEAEISTILYIMEGYLQNSDDVTDPSEFDMTEDEFQNDVDAIFKKLETPVDAYYDKVEKAKAKQPKAEWGDDEWRRIEDPDYNDCVDHLVESMSQS